MPLTLKHSHFALISGDADLVRQVSYLFRIVLGCDLSILADFPESFDRGEDVGKADLVVLHASRPASEDQASIKKLKAHNPDQVVIVIRSNCALTVAKALAAGAQDVVSLPLNLPEFASRVALRLGDQEVLDHAARDSATWDAEAFISERAALTTVESQVMRVLYRRAGETVSRDELSDVIYGRPWVYGDRRFDVHVAKLRKKLSDAFGDDICVTTIRSSGYVLDVSDFIWRKRA